MTVTFGSKPLLHRICVELLIEKPENDRIGCVFLVHLGQEGGSGLLGRGLPEHLFWARTRSREQQTIWVGPRRFLPQQQPRKKVKPATRGASGEAPAIGRTLGETGHYAVRLDSSE